MGFLQGLHGAIGIVIICLLLFVEEAGVPVFFSPGEVTLLIAGLLIATGAMDPFIGIPTIVVACIAGALLGFSWARLVGERSLKTLAAKVHREKALERVSQRLANASAPTIAISRLIPGLRIYTTLVAGALHVPRKNFILGMVPATALWVAVWVALGALAGLPIAHFLTNVEKLAIQGLLLVIIGGGVLIAVRRAPGHKGMGTASLPAWMRITAAAAVDLAIISAIVSGLLSLGPRLFAIGTSQGWADLGIIAGVAGIFYLLVLRGTVGSTMGEALMQTTYASRHRGRLHPAGAIAALVEHCSASTDDLSGLATVLRAMGDTARLHILQTLNGGPADCGQLQAATGIPDSALQHHLIRLEQAGLIEAEGDDPDNFTYRLSTASNLAVARVIATVADSTRPPSREKSQKPA